MGFASTIETIGLSREPLAIIDGFAEDPDQLRDLAETAPFAPADQHYPGIRASLPSHYLTAQLPLIAKIVVKHFSRCRRINVVDASYSIVTSGPEALRVGQRLPHVDAYGRERIALVHFLSPENADGTAFYRHRSTGFEFVDAERAPVYFSRLDGELNDRGAPPPGYINGDTALFEQIAGATARYNRALLYRSYLLHSGAISPDVPLPADPVHGRLTVTGFFAIE